MEPRIEPRRPSLRKKLLINKSVQLRVICFAATFGIIGAAGPAATGLVLDFLENTWIGSGITGLLPAFMVPLVAFLIAVLFGIQFSNRLVGPVFHLEKHMRGIIAGDEAKPIHFRKHDFFQDVEATYNQLIEGIPRKDQTQTEDQHKGAASR